MSNFKSKKTIYIILFIAFALIFFWENKKLSGSLDAVETESATNTIALKTATSLASASAVSNAPSAPTTNQDSNLKDQTPAQFADWLKSEAQLLDKNDPNNADKEIILKAKAAQFTESNIKYLRKIATDAAASANERIVAVYFLSLSSDKALPELIDVAGSPFSLPNPQPVHSIGEATLMQEKAIRVVAIDELFNRFENNAITRAQLENGISRISESSLKQYAARRLADLK